MGCTDSSVAMPPRTSNSVPAQNYNNNSSTMFYQMQNAKRPKFLNPQELSQNQKELLWSIIQRNSLKEFAYFIQSQGIPSNVEVGPSNTFWNFAHFCARWDAFECLTYIIKKVYAEKSTLLLSLMNQQTIEGFTAMHVAIQWNAVNCFYAMIDHGGIDLSYTDKANNDVFAKANLFKRSEMLQVLERFRAGNALMILVQSEKARGFQTFNEMAAAGQIPTRSEYRISNQRINQVIDTRNRMNKPPPPLPPKQNNPNKYQNYQKAIKEIENKGTTATEGSSEEQNLNRLKLEEQRRFQEEQARIKKQQAEDLKRALQMQKDEQQKRLREQEQKQIRKQRTFQQAELSKIEKEKELMRKNIEAMHSNMEQSKRNFGKTKMVCPEDIKQFYQAALAKGTKFIDTEFPAEQKSLGNIQDFKFGWHDCVWLRPQKMFPGGKFEVFDGISPQDVKQGTLAVCYYLALLSSIAENEQRIKKVFRFYDKDLGFYALQFYLGGKPKTIIVDDLIPCMKGTNEPLFAKPRSPEVWVMIFEKAWVKMFGSYLAAQKMSSSDMFENVIPAPCRDFIIDVSRIDHFYDKFVEFDKKNYIMTATTPGNSKVPPGIVQQHAYSLIGVYNINGTKICKIRNPWGKTEYEGMYSETSTLWTPELQKAVGFQKGDDGIFYLTSTQLQSVMPIVTVSLYKDDYQYSYIDVKSKSNQQVYFVINVKKKGEVAIKLTQQNQRFVKNMQYENSPIRLEVCKLGDNYDAKIISDGEPSTMYDGALNLFSNENIYENLQVGRYLIRLKVMYDRAQVVSTRGTYRKFIRGTNGKEPLKVRQSTSLLSMYGPQSYVFNRISKQEGEKYMKNVYKNYMLSIKEPSERLRSVGQDLKPMVIAKDCKMRNQIIYMAQNHLPSNSINFKFQFHHQKFRNCSYAYNVNKQTESCDWVIEPGGWNLATLQIDCPFQEIATEGELQPTFKIIR